MSRPICQKGEKRKEERGGEGETTAKQDSNGLIVSTLNNH
jgi:hypothetical protein